MIFRPELAAKVLSGDKTVTRRRLTHLGGKPIKYQVGKTYSVQEGRGKKHIGHILIQDIKEVPLGFMGHRPDDEARDEGFASQAEFAAYWTQLHGGYNSEELVARIRFELAQPCAECWDADRDYDLAEPDKDFGPSRESYASH